MGVLRRKSANSRSKPFEDQYERPTVQHFPANEICFSCGCILLDDLSSGSWRWKITSPCHVLLYIYMVIYICIYNASTKFLRDHLRENKNIVIVIVREEEIRQRFFDVDIYIDLRCGRSLGRKLGCNVWNGTKFNWKFC